MSTPSYAPPRLGASSRTTATPSEPTLASLSRKNSAPGNGPGAVSPAAASAQPGGAVGRQRLGHREANAPGAVAMEPARRRPLAELLTDDPHHPRAEDRRLRGVEADVGPGLRRERRRRLRTGEREGAE